jgi:hypothetical protein
VAIDTAKRYHAVLIETTDGTHQRLRTASTMEDHQRFVDLLRGMSQPVRIAMKRQEIAIAPWLSGFCWRALTTACSPPWPLSVPGADIQLLRFAFWFGPCDDAGCARPSSPPPEPALDESSV